AAFGWSLVTVTARSLQAPRFSRLWIMASAMASSTSLPMSVSKMMGTGAAWESATAEKNRVRCFSMSLGWLEWMMGSKAFAEAVRDHGEDDDAAGDDAFHRFGDAGLRQPRFQRGHDQDAEK